MSHLSALESLIMLSLAPLSLGFSAPVVATPAAARATVAMDLSKGPRYMYDEPYAPAGMGREFINEAGVRKPIEEFVGASEEMDLAGYFRGEAAKVWDPMEFHKLSKVSANNPDVAWLREAELKHGRVCMLAFVGILVTSGGTHFGAPVFTEAAAAGWPDSLGVIQKLNGGIFAQGIAAIAIVEGVSNTNSARGGAWWDGLWFGERAGGVVAGDFGWDPLKLMPKDAKAAERMKLKELKNGRLAMLAVMGMFFEYIQTGKAFGDF